MLRLRHLALGAGFFFITLAIFTQGVLPALQPQSRDTKVTRVVRTDLGELKWTVSEASDYTPLERRGRRVYTIEGCWYCHSQYVRPVTGETRRWGPVSQAGEYAFDRPHLFSTRRIGPDLTRVGMKFSDEWHLAHFWNPRMVVPDSIMPSFSYLFDGPYGPVKVVEKNGERTLEQTPLTEKLFKFDSEEEILLTPNPDGLTFVSTYGKRPVIFTPNEEYTGDTVQLVGMTEDLRGLIAYVQKLGMNRGNWRDLFEPQRLDVAQMSLPRSEEWIEYGKAVYERRCRGLPRRERRWQRPGRNFPAQSPAARVHCGSLQVPHNADRLAPYRWRSAARPRARRARDRDAVLARAAREGSLGRDPVRQVRVGGGPQRSEKTILLLRRGTGLAPDLRRRPAGALGADRL